MTENYRQLNYTSDQINEKLGKVDVLSQRFSGLEKKANITEKEVNSIKGDGYDSEEIKPTLMSLEANLAKLQGSSKEDAGSVTHLWWAHNNLENSVQEIQNTYVTQENLQKTDDNINALSETMEEFYATKQEVNTLEQEIENNYALKSELSGLASIKYVDELIGNINSILATLSDGGNANGDN